MNFIFYDFEVFKYNWLVTCNINGTKSYSFWNEDLPELKKFFEEHKKDIWVGFNNKFYDQYIMKAVLNDENPYPVSVAIVEDKVLGFKAFRKPNYIKMINLDLKDDLPLNLSLKEIEANLGMKIHESSVPFDLGRELNEKERQETLEYNLHDVKTTINVFNERETWVKSKLGLITRFSLGMENIGASVPKLASMILGAERISRDKVFNYKPPKELRIEKYDSALNFYTAKPINSLTAIDTNIVVARVDHVVSTGGIHGALEKVFLHSNSEYIIINLDVASYYPALMILFKFLSRNVTKQELYKEIRDERIRIKKAAKEAKVNGDLKALAELESMAEALKLVINIIYGGMSNEGNDMYDPVQRMNVCITGQLFLIDLIEKIEKEDIILIQSNTDGIVFKVKRDKLDSIRTIYKEWESRTGFELEETKIDYIYQKDVNNYIAVFDNKEVKTKGSFVKYWEGGDYKKNHMPIVDRLVVLYFVDEITPQVSKNDKAIDYQLVAKAGSMYGKITYEKDGNETPIQKVNRLFVVKENGGSIFKWKGDSKQKLSGIPNSVIIINDDIRNLTLKDLEEKYNCKIDEEFYKNEAYNRIYQYITKDMFRILNKR